ncbi:MAG TPA: hypothetical protein VFE45_18820 [Coriobacteriia bacterium]|nr:hypothetical protein [Coriobacteriia bacterium]
MRVPIYARRALCAAVSALAVVVAAGCFNAGTELDFTVAAIATDDGGRDTSATVDPDAIATAWAEVGGSDRPSVPDGQVEVLVSVNYQLWGPEVSEVRAGGDTWTVHISAYDLDGCYVPAEVVAVTYLLHVTADTPPDTINATIDMKHGCGD